MSGPGAGAQRRWAASAAGACVVLALVVLFARVTEVPVAVPLPVAPPRPVQLEQQSRTNDETAIRDQTPLFLPTERNVALKPRVRRQAGGSLLDQDALKLTFGESDPALRMPEPVVLAEKPAELVLADAAPVPVYGFGRVEVRAAPPPPRGATVEVLTARTNQRVLLELLPPEAKPASAKPWRPMEFAVKVDASGLVGGLMLPERSDAEEAENFFRQYLARTFRIGERLPPGFYRVIVGP